MKPPAPTNVQFVFPGFFSPSVISVIAVPGNGRTKSKWIVSFPGDFLILILILILTLTGQSNNQAETGCLDAGTGSDATTRCGWAIVAIDKQSIFHSG